MRVVERFAVVLLVLVGGLAFALLFRKENPEYSPNAPRPSDQLNLRKQTDFPSEIQSTLPIPTARDIRQSGAGRNTISEGAVEFGEGRGPEVDLPPDLAPEYRRQLVPSEPPFSVRPQGSPGSALADPAARSSRTVPSVPSRSSPQSSRFCKVVDGDTLRRLAQRYLGSSDRYLEIYEKNRDVLLSPDLLPIGVVLEIPPREPAAEHSKPSAESKQSRVPI